MRSLRVEEIVKRIRAKRPDLTEAEVLSLIKDKKAGAGGLLSEEGAAKLVEEELVGPEVQVREANQVLPISNIVAGLRDVTIAGRISSILPVREFRRADGSLGKVLRLILTDKTGAVTCAIWDEAAEALLKVTDLHGRIFKIAHGYTRQGLAGQVEVHLGRRGKFELDPKDIDLENIPKPEELFSRIGAIRSDTRYANVVGCVEVKPRATTFEVQGKSRIVLRTVISDKTGSMAFVAWGKRAEELKELEKGSLIKIIRGRVRPTPSGLLEIHADEGSQVSVLAEAPEGYEPREAKFLKISELKTSIRYASVAVVPLKIGEVREVKRPSGEARKFARALVCDETGLVTLTLWGDKVSMLPSIKEGMVLLVVEDAAVKERLGEIYLSAGDEASIKLKPLKDLKGSIPKATKIAEVPSASGLLSVEGEVVEEPSLREVVVGDELTKVASLRLRDDTGQIRLTFWRAKAEEASRLRAGMRIRVFGLRAKPGLGGEVELTAIPLALIQKLNGDAERPSWQEIKHIIALKEGEEAWIKAMVLDVQPTSTMSVKCVSCDLPISLAESGPTCSRCGGRDYKWTISLNVILDDGTGAIPGLLEDHEGHLIPRLGWEEHAMKEMLKRLLTTIQLPQDLAESLKGKMIEAYGYIRVEPKQGKRIFNIKKVVA